MDLLGQILSATPPPAFAIFAREGREDIEVIAGRTEDVLLLGDIPLVDSRGVPQEVLALVPFRQVVERGYQAVDDRAPLRCLIVSRRESYPRDHVLAALPAGTPPVLGGDFEVSDEDYANVVRTVIDDEIGRGEGANFVLRRDYVATTSTATATAVLQLLRRLLIGEHGSYWTFAVVTPEISLVGASPERHVSVDSGIVRMNPISGTYRHPVEGEDAEGLLHFLSDRKEVEELFMVVDEELKMMSTVCSSGGVIEGPFLKQMAHLTHTEYTLCGQSSMDVRDILRETMFAPTVTGSPMENACAVIARHEKTPRGYYGGVAALISPDESGGYSLDAPILIRTAHLDAAGRIRVPAGATIVRHSRPEHEVEETRTKAGGVLAALGLRSPSASRTRVDIFSDEIQSALNLRNAKTAAFWMREQHPPKTGEYSGRTAVIVDGEDRFSSMLAHQLRHLGMSVQVVRWDDPAVDRGDPLTDLLVCGPGPGDPRASNSRMSQLSKLIDSRLNSGRPLLAVCLSHQLLAIRLGLDVVRLESPRQGVPLQIDLFGTPATIGFYNTFGVRISANAPSDVELAVDPTTGDVFAMRGHGFASIQGHLESVLSIDGLASLDRLIAHAMATRG